MDGTGTPDDLRQLTTAPGSTTYTMHRQETSDPLLVCQLLVCQAGTTRLPYLLSAVEDLHAILGNNRLRALPA